MSICSDEQRAQCFNNAQQKIAIISSVGRSFIVNAEEFARGYAQALAEAGVLSFDQRDELYVLTTEAVERRRHKLTVTIRKDLQADK